MNNVKKPDGETDLFKTEVNKGVIQGIEGLTGVDLQNVDLLSMLQVGVKDRYNFLMPSTISITINKLLE